MKIVMNKNKGWMMAIVAMLLCVTMVACRQTPAQDMEPTETTVHTGEATVPTVDVAAETTAPTEETIAPPEETVPVENTEPTVPIEEAEDTTPVPDDTGKGEEEDEAGEDKDESVATPEPEPEPTEPPAAPEVESGDVESEDKQESEPAEEDVTAGEDTPAEEEDASQSSGGDILNYVGPASPSTGLSWDGVSPIIYTYPDGSTGTEPMPGATYEREPGVISTYTDGGLASIETGPSDAESRCGHCGKVRGDGSNGTCIRWLIPGEYTCTCCGATVPAHTCHSCG